ncbi:transcriptional regulatory protein Dep1p [Monosporozyma servazzii]
MGHRDEDEESALTTIDNNEPIGQLNIDEYCISSDADTEKMGSDVLHDEEELHPKLSDLLVERKHKLEDDLDEEATKKVKLELSLNLGKGEDLSQENLNEEDLNETDLNKDDLTKDELTRETLPKDELTRETLPKEDLDKEGLNDNNLKEANLSNNNNKNDLSKEAEYKNDLNTNDFNKGDSEDKILKQNVLDSNDLNNNDLHNNDLHNNDLHNNDLHNNDSKDSSNKTDLNNNDDNDLNNKTDLNNNNDNEDNEDNNDNEDNDDNDSIEEDTNDTPSPMELETKRLEAMDDIISIEYKFAQLRQNLYENKLNKLELELQMCLEGSHPELHGYYERISSIRDYKLKRAYQRQKYELSCIDKETRATRTMIHQQYYKSVSELKSHLLKSTTREWYDINKERREMDTMVANVGYHVPVKIANKTLSCITGYAGAAQERLPGEPLAEDLECENTAFQYRHNPVDKLEVIVDRMRLNNQLSDLEGLKRYYGGFPAAPGLNGLRDSEINDDFEAIQYFNLAN